MNISTHEQFVEALRSGNFRTMCSLVNEVSEDTLNKELYNACLNKNHCLIYDLIRFGAKYDSIKFCDENIDVLKWLKYNHKLPLVDIFIKACNNNDLKLVKWLRETSYSVNKFAPLDRLYREAIQDGNLELAKLLNTKTYWSSIIGCFYGYWNDTNSKKTN